MKLTASQLRQIIREELSESRRNPAGRFKVGNEGFETQAEASFDRIVCVSCSPEIQRKRLQSRGWRDGEIERRLAAQMEIDEKMKRSDHVVWTDGPIEAQAAQWDALLSSWDGLA